MRLFLPPFRLGIFILIIWDMYTYVADDAANDSFDKHQPAIALENVLFQPQVDTWKLPLPNAPPRLNYQRSISFPSNHEFSAQDCILVPGGRVDLELSSNDCLKNLSLIEPTPTINYAPLRKPASHVFFSFSCGIVFDDVRKCSALGFWCK